VVGGGSVTPATTGTADIARMLLNHDDPAVASREPAAPVEAKPQNGADSFEERVRKLKFMFDNGLISQEQYQQKIDQIMSEI